MSIILVLLVSVPLVVMDQLIKLTIRGIPLGTVVFRLPPLFEITHCINTGAAFSLFSGYNAGLIFGSVLLICAVVYVFFYRVHLSLAAKAALSVLIGGGIGNLIDRFMFGCVTDYIRLLFMRFPVFNLADIAITVSAFALMILAFADKLEVKTGDK